MAKQEWIDVGDATELAKRELQQVMLKRTRIALTCRNGEFSVRLEHYQQKMAQPANAPGYLATARAEGGPLHGRRAGL